VGSYIGGGTVNGKGRVRDPVVGGIQFRPLCLRPFPSVFFFLSKKKTGGGGRSRGGQSQTHREIRFNMRGLERESRRGGRCFIELMGFEHDMGLWELGTGGRCWWCC
jgi:hypothetical protein